MKKIHDRYLTESLIASGFKKGLVQWTKIKLNLALSFLKKNKRNYCSKSWKYQQMQTQSLYRYGCSFVAKLSWKKNYFFEKIYAFYKITLFAEKMFLYGKKKFYIENFFY